MPSRFRTRTRPDVISNFELSWKGGAPTLNPTVVDYYVEEMSDIVTSDFHSKIASGVVINNPCNMLLHTLSVKGECAYYAYVTSNPAQYYQGQGGSFTSYFLPTFGTSVWTNEIPPFPVDRMRRVAKQKCLANVDATPYEFGEDLGEIGETIRFLKNPFAAIKSISKAFKEKKGRIQRKWPTKRQKAQTRKDWLWTQRKRAEALADLWNQTRFALLPLIRSAMSALEAWNEEGGTRPERRKARWVENKSQDLHHTFKYETALDPNSYINVRRAGEQSLDIRPVIMYEVTNPLYDWKFRLGLRLKDLPTTAWQLVPLSFMVDRVVDISAAIAGLINLADPQVKILAASITERDHREFDVQILEQIHPTYTCSVTGDVVHTKYFVYDRKVWNPGVLDAVPAFTPGKLVGDITSILDLAAIAISLLRGVGRN